MIVFLLDQIALNELDPLGPPISIRCLKIQSAFSGDNAKGQPIELHRDLILPHDLSALRPQHDLLHPLQLYTPIHIQHLLPTLLHPAPVNTGLVLVNKYPCGLALAIPAVFQENVTFLQLLHQLPQLITH